MKINKTIGFALLTTLGTVCFFVVWRFKLSPWLGAVVLVAALYGLHRYLRALESSQNLRAIYGALPKLDRIHAGLRFLGTESELIDWRRADDPREEGPIRIVQLCRTKKGQWFEYRFDLRYGHVRADSINLLDEERARTWLSYDLKAYKRTFSLPEVA
jgi:hypothetical protein